MTPVRSPSPRPAESAGPLSHAQHWHAGMVQAASRPGELNLSPGYLEPGLLPVDLMAAAYRNALAEFGAAALGYGANPGAQILRECLATRATAADRRPCGPENVLVTAGTSQALQLLSTTLAAPGETVYAEPTCYDLGRKIITDHGLQIRQVPTDTEGMNPAALREAVRATRTAGQRPAFVYLNPTFHNPTGRVTGVSRRHELLAAVADQEVPIVEDDAYAELNLEQASLPPSLAGLAGHAGVIRLGSFAKTLAPGLRLGWLQADPSIVEAIAERGQLVSGGSLNHVTSLAVAVLLRDGGYDKHLHWLRAQLRDRRDALVTALRASLDPGIGFAPPTGGFFVWLRFPTEQTESALLSAAADSHVTVAAGSRFGTVDRPSIRLAYSFNPASSLATAAHQLALAWKRVSP